jgi:hypothetical protein
VSPFDSPQHWSAREDRVKRAEHECMAKENVPPILPRMSSSSLKASPPQGSDEEVVDTASVAHALSFWLQELEPVTFHVSGEPQHLSRT